MDVNSKLMAVAVFGANLLMLGAVNLSAIWDLMQEIVDNTDVIIGLIIMGVTISIALYIGTFVKNLLSSATKKQ